MNFNPRKTLWNGVYCRVEVLLSNAECKCLYSLLWESDLLFGAVVTADKSTVNNRRRTSLAVDRNVTRNIRSVSKALYKVKTDLLSDALDSNSTSPEVAAVRISQEQIEKCEINEHLDFSAHTQALQESPCTETHRRLCATKKADLKLNGVMMNRSWKIVGPPGETIIAGHPRYELKDYYYFIWMLT